MKMEKYAEGIQNEKLLKWGGNAHVYCLDHIRYVILFVIDVRSDNKV